VLHWALFVAGVGLFMLALNAIAVPKSPAFKRSAHACYSPGSLRLSS
jgi:hypothetical protein